MARAPPPTRPNLRQTPVLLFATATAGQFDCNCPPAFLHVLRSYVAVLTGYLPTLGLFPLLHALWAVTSTFNLVLPPTTFVLKSRTSNNIGNARP